MSSRLAVMLAFALASCDGGNSKSSAPPGMWEEFSGDNALRHVQRMVDLGPRPPASEAIEKTRSYLMAELEAAGWRVTRQAFSNETPQGTVIFVNLLGTFGGETPGSSAPSFLLCSHYDTKFFTIQRFVGANDGGSSTGLLLEMARVLGRHPDLARKVQLAFFDGEEAYVSFTETDGLYGSRYFAQQLKADGKAKQFRGGILFDMVGDRELDITLPTDSPAEIARGIFAAAEALGVRKHFTYSVGAILDDHVPLNEIGIPTIDLIDFNYPSWHTTADTMDKLSAESLKIVGSVATRYLVESAFK